jgi:hypothetical protein
MVSGCFTSCVITHAMWTVLNPAAKLQWMSKHYPSNFVMEVKKELLQAVSDFNFVSHSKLKF